MHSFSVFLFALLVIFLYGECAPLTESAVLYAPEYHFYWPGYWIGPPSAPVRDPSSGKIDFFAECNGNVSSLLVGSSKGWCHFSSFNYSTWYRDSSSPLLGPDYWYNLQGTLAGSASVNTQGEEVILYTCRGGDGIERICLSTASTKVTSSNGLVTQLSQSSLNPIFSVLDTANSCPLASGSSWTSPSRFWSSHFDSGKVWYLGAVATDVNETAIVGLFSTTDSFLLNGITYTSVLYRDGNFSRFATPEVVDLTASTGTLTPVPSSSSYTHLLKLTMVDGERDYVIYGTLSISNSSSVPQFVEDASHPPTFVDLGSFQQSKVISDAVTRTQRVVGYIPEDLVDPVVQSLTQGWSGALSIPRVIRYVYKEQRIAFSPMPEIKSLRREVLFDDEGAPIVLSSSSSSTLLRNGDQVILAPLSLRSKAAAQHEIVVRFVLPEGWLTTAADAGLSPEFGVLIRATPTFSAYTRVGVQIPTATSCGSDQKGMHFRTMQLRGAFDDNNTQLCSDLCSVNMMCQKWETTLRPYGMDCELYTLLGEDESEEGSCGTETGCPLNSPNLVMDRSFSGTSGNASVLSGRAVFSTSHPQLLELRIFVDNSVIEVFKDDGLESLSGRVYVPEDQNAIGIYAKNLVDGMNVTVTSNVFSMGSMWAPAGEVMVQGELFYELKSFSTSLGEMINTRPY